MKKNVICAVCNTKMDWENPQWRCWTCLSSFSKASFNFLMKDYCISGRKKYDVVSLEKVKGRSVEYLIIKVKYFHIPNSKEDMIKAVNKLITLSNFN